MPARPTFSKEQIEFIQQRTKEGKQYKTIFREFKKTYDISKMTAKEDSIYAKLCYWGRKIKPSKTKERIQLNFIENVSDLCKFMTKWVTMLMGEYEKAQECVTVAHDVRGSPIIVTPKKDIRPEINRAYRNFVELLKTPAFQGTQVNILEQRMQMSLMEVLNERKSAAVVVPEQR